MNTRQIEKRIKSIVQREGRRPRVLLAHLENGQPDHWTKPLAASLAEFGFDVDIGPGNQPLVLKLAEALEAKGGADIRLVAGGAGLQPNQEELYRAGLDLIVDFDKSNINLIGGMLDLLDESGASPGP